MKCQDFLGGVLIGAIVGAAVGLLMAPQSGEETRSVVREQARDLSDKMKDSSKQLLESGRDLLEQGKSQVTSTMHTYVQKVGTITAKTVPGSDEA
jgi:gas vesicle protein